MKAYLITKDKKVIVRDTNERNKFMFWNDGAYRLESSCVRLSFKKGGINPTAEIIFTENSPLPINSEKKEDKLMFDEVILRNALESVAHATHSNSLFGFLKDINGTKAVTYIVMALFGIYILWQYTHGGFR